MTKYLTSKAVKASPLYREVRPLYDIFVDIVKNRYYRTDGKNGVYWDEYRPETILQMLHDAFPRHYPQNPRNEKGKIGAPINFSLMNMMVVLGLSKK
eukprot:3881579-Pyramimonas_sp.AAC.1